MARFAPKGHCDRVLRYVAGGVFMESGYCRGLGLGLSFGTEMYYTQELIDALAALVAGAPTSWIDWLSTSLASTSRVYEPGMPSLSLHTDARLRDYAGDFNYSTHSGKGLLLWQATAGTRAVKRSAYDGPTIP